jgi:hypothetical protein
VINRLLVVSAVAAGLLAALAPGAHAAAWKSCGSLSALVDEGNHRATAHVAMRRDPDATIVCATARSVGRRVLRIGPADSLTIATRVWYMDWAAAHDTTFIYSRGPHAIVRVRLTTRPA